MKMLNTVTVDCAYKVSGLCLHDINSIYYDDFHLNVNNFHTFSIFWDSNRICTSILVQQREMFHQKYELVFFC